MLKQLILSRSDTRTSHAGERTSDITSSKLQTIQKQQDANLGPIQSIKD